MRSIIIGDIHGCSRALETLLERLAPRPGKDRLILLGDLFDRGPDSFGVWQAVRRLDETFGSELVLLRGNHEDYLIRPKLTLREKIIWNRVGRQATVSSFKRAGQRMEDTASWLKERMVLFHREKGFQCVHAGVKVEPAEANDLQTLLHDHGTVPENRYGGTFTVTGHIALEKAVWFAGDGETVWEPGEESVHLLPEKGILCIDTGCGKGGRLTAMIAEGDSFRLTSIKEA